MSSWKTNPKAEIVRYENCGHRCHAERAFERRFFVDVENFLQEVTSR